MNRINKSLFGLLLLACAGVAFGQFWNTDYSGVRLGEAYNISDGTKVNLLECTDLSFAGDTSKTWTSDVPTGGTYYIAAVFKSSSADPGKITAAISSGTGTVTVANATTGTCSVIVFGAP